MKFTGYSVVAAVLLVLNLGGGLTLASEPKRPLEGHPAAFKKVLIVVFENADYQDALKQPDLAKLAERGALLTNFHGVAHPSQPNYIALVSGDTHGVTNDKTVSLDARNLGDLLDAAHKSWKVYLEGFPGACFRGAKAGNYVRKHNALLDFANVQKNSERCAKLVPADELQRDIQSGQLPDFSIYIPDLKNDGHDTGVKFAGRWLSQSLLPRLADRLAQDLMLAVTFDESDSTSGDNRIYTALIGAGVKPQARSEARYDHYSLLRTIENQFRLGTLGLNDEKAASIEGIWN